MPFVDPQTVNNPTAGAAATAAWGDAVRDAAVYLATNKPHARVYNSAAISIPNAAFTAVTFDSERYDVGSCHSTVTNTGRLTVPTGEGGVYLIGGHLALTANASVNRGLRIMVNGTTTIASHINFSPSAAATGDLSVVTEYALAAADYVTLHVYQDSGGALNTLTTAAFSCEFWFRWVST